MAVVKKRPYGRFVKGVKKARHGKRAAATSTSRRPRKNRKRGPGRRIKRSTRPRVSHHSYFDAMHRRDVPIPHHDLGGGFVTLKSCLRTYWDASDAANGTKTYMLIFFSRSALRCCQITPDRGFVPLNDRALHGSQPPSHVKPFCQSVRIRNVSKALDVGGTVRFAVCSQPLAFEHDATNYGKVSEGTLATIAHIMESGRARTLTGHELRTTHKFVLSPADMDQYTKFQQFIDLDSWGSSVENAVKATYYNAVDDACRTVLSQTYLVIEFNTFGANVRYDVAIHETSAARYVDGTGLSRFHAPTTVAGRNPHFEQQAAAALGAASSGNVGMAEG
jgi:hypothetical protein